eukprot:Sspe_Gene.78201::Locus_48911_Transcript_1_1_Confidence_1.000_Length_773::g.78201::m.78201
MGVVCMKTAILPGSFLLPDTHPPSTQRMLQQCSSSSGLVELLVGVIGAIIVYAALDAMYELHVEGERSTAKVRRGGRLFRQTVCTPPPTTQLGGVAAILLVQVLAVRGAPPTPTCSTQAALPEEILETVDLTPA